MLGALILQVMDKNEADAIKVSQTPKLTFSTLELKKNFM